MFKIAICEDCRIEREVLSEFLLRYRESRPDTDISVRYFDCGLKLLDDIAESQSYDMFLLDILMPGISGIELARKLRESDPDVPVVFLTGSPDYALDAFGVSAAHYILKPVTEPTLFSVLNKAVERKTQDENSFFLLSLPERIVKVPFASVIYVELCERAMRFRLRDGSSLLSKRIREPFETVIAPLLTDRRFLYAHKSFVLNMAYVREMTNSSFIMTGGVVIPVPRYKFAGAKAKYLNYLSQCGIDYTGG